MNFSAEVKRELVKEKLKSPCCKRAALSAFLRTAGTIETYKGKVGFSASADDDILEYFGAIIKSLYGGAVEIKSDKGEKRKRLRFIGDEALNALIDCEILKTEQSGLDIIFGVSKYIVEDDCCKRAFVTGAFLGSGSVTVPSFTGGSKTGYHLEFTFNMYQVSADFSDILCALGFTPKSVERKDSFVVYFKSSEEIADVLTVMGAKKASLALTDLIIKKGVMNNTNRALNCEMSNITKSVEASVKIREAIALIESVASLSSLPPKLREVAEARTEDPEASLSELADKLGITKSCLCHRLDKIKKIAESL
ncbi:MAG TPA: DNA-binding protein WhiA [Clostridiales bacterium]|nr:DNA-binding protein WhiA [Clostridiales bacterium]